MQILGIKETSSIINFFDVDECRVAISRGQNMHRNNDKRFKFLQPMENSGQWKMVAKWWTLVQEHRRNSSIGERKRRITEKA